VGHTLSQSLPVADTPEDMAREIDAAKTALASLCPVTPAEYNVASAHVGMLAHMAGCMQELRDPALTFQQRMQVRAQMASMLRQALGAQRTLERMMAQRVKRDAVPKEADAAGVAEHIAYSAMTRPFAQVFGEGEVARATPQPPPLSDADVEGVGDLPEPVLGRASPPRGRTMTLKRDGCDANAAPTPTPTSSQAPDPESEIDDSPDVAWYEAVYPERAALIRGYGGVPGDVSFGPPDEATVRALLATRPMVGGAGPPGG
jgi:hypothetical protein